LSPRSAKAGSPKPRESHHSLARRALFLSNGGDAAVAARAEGKHAIVTAYEHAIVEYVEQFPPQPR
jgi:hypothetical protein